MDPYFSTKGRNQDEQEVIDSLMNYERCDDCSRDVSPVDLEIVAGHKLCPDCAPTWKEQIAEDLREKTVQAGFDAMTTDELLTLKWCLSVMMLKMDDKENTENIRVLDVRTREALNSKE